MDNNEIAGIIKNIGDNNLNDLHIKMPPLINNLDWMDNLTPAHNPTYDLIEKQEEANELLKEISLNTAVLKEIVEINRKTQLNTEELTYVMKVIYAVAKAETKEEADNLLSKAIGVINSSGEAVGNISSLITILMGIYNTVQPLL